VPLDKDPLTCGGDCPNDEGVATGAVRSTREDQFVQVPVSRFLILAVRWAALALAVLAAPAGATMPAVSGPLPAEVSSAFSDGLFELPAPRTELGVSAVQPVFRIPVILVSYTDEPLTYGAATFDTALFDTTHATATGSLHDYYRWVSGNRLGVLGRVVATVQLPQNKLYYGYNSFGLSRTATPHNAAGLVRDALAACASQVQWSNFDLDRDGFVDMLWVVHAGLPGEAAPDRLKNDLWSITSRLSNYWTGSSAYETPELVPGSVTQHMRIDRFSVLPELSYFAPGQRSEIGVFCHEFGHALGVPDLYNVRDGGTVNAGPGNWSLMGTGMYGGDGHSPQYPTHLGAWPALYMGWTQTMRPTEDTSVLLPPLGGEAQILDLSFQGETNPEHFLVETRRRAGFDRNLPADGLIVYHVNDVVIGQGIQSNTVNSGPTPGLVIVEASGSSDLTNGINRGDAGDAYPGTSGRSSLFDGMTPPNTLSFLGAPMGVGLFDIAPVAEGVSLLAQVRAIGWEPATDRTVGDYAPTEAQTPAVTAGLAPDGTGYSVVSESRLGHLQVVLRTRRAGVWDAGFAVSQSSGDAFEPALALLGADGLALVWCDTRWGAPRLVYRARVGGVWTPEQVLSTLSGEHRAPSIGADSKGGVYVAWVVIGLDLPAIHFLRFPYLSPYGQPFTVSGTTASPANPLVTALPSGGAIVSWTDNAAWPATLWFSRCGPDSIPAPPQKLTPWSGLTQTWVSTVAESSGVLHNLWIESNSSGSELHYQRRLPFGGFAPADTVVETSSSTIARARVGRDPLGGVHVVFERSVGGVAQVRYRRWHPSLGWDANSTDVTMVADGSAVQPAVLAASTGRVIVLYRSFPGGVPRFMERCRTTDAPGVLAAPQTAMSPLPSPISIRPNPIHAGRDVEFTCGAASERPAAGTPSAALEVYDLAGRRMAVVDLQPGGAQLHGRVGSSLTRSWQAGMYFVRLRGAPGPAQRLVVLR
jgi:M6 family metalloprotease-like protein